MTKLIVTILISIVFATAFWTLPIFYPSIEFILLPIILLQWLAGIAGVIVIPIAIIKQMGHRSIRLNNLTILCVGTALGLYVGYIIGIPIDRWDVSQRNLSGQIIVSNLEQYKVQNGSYPEDLSQLDIVKLNQALPRAYNIDRFNYSKGQNDFDLDVPIPLTERWHWDVTTGTFVYQD